MLRVERSVSWADTEADLQLVRAPVLLLWGSQDRDFPVRLIDRFIARLPTVEHHVLPDCGHLVHDDCPEQTYALLPAFLQQDTQPSPPTPAGQRCRRGDRPQLPSGVLLGVVFMVACLVHDGRSSPMTTDIATDVMDTRPLTRGRR